MSDPTAEQLRALVETLRRTPKPLSEIIPLLQRAADEIDLLNGNLKAMKSFADLWYFVCDEKPLQFERIVCEYSPQVWLQEAHKLMKEHKK